MTGGSAGMTPLPGMEKCAITPYIRDVKNSVAYSDHWVSNVVDREGFMEVRAWILLNSKTNMHFSHVCILPLSAWQMSWASPPKLTLMQGL